MNEAWIGNAEAHLSGGGMMLGLYGWERGTPENIGTDTHPFIARVEQVTHTKWTAAVVFSPEEITRPGGSIWVHRYGAM